MTITQTRPTEQNPSSQSSGRRYRPELQGLRALAVVLVVVYHVWLGRVSGGVDVFFLITGFLITGQLFRARLRGGIEFRPMWGRMIKRLLPASTVVLLATMALAVVFLPEQRWFGTIREVVASALFYENWVLVATSTDYFADHDTASVVQHFWSLSIQGQFYLLWPLLIAVVALLVRRAGWSLRRTVFAVLVVVFAASLALSVWLTAENQPLAYFMTPTRLWEFALGGMLALVIDRVALPRLLRIVLGWVGVVGLVLCGLVLTVGQVFPGYAALWPTMSAVCVLLAGATESKVGADRWLSSRPLEYVGNISYALYLWHWPLLVFFLLATDQTEPDIVGGLAIIGVSFALSAATYHFVEQPVRNSRIGQTTRWGAYRFGVVALVPVLAAAVVWQVVSTNRASFAPVLDDPRYPGAQVIAAGIPSPETGGSVVPPFAALPDEWVAFSDDECRISPRNEDLRICTVDPSGPPVRRIAVVGDSHSQQHIAALIPSVEKRGWQIISIGKGGCPLTADPNWPEDNCPEWNEAVIAELAEMRPDVVVTMATRDVRFGLQERTPEGYVEQWRKLADLGIPVVALRDHPRYDYDPSECAHQKGIDAPECMGRKADYYPPEPPYASIPDIPPTVSFVDFSDYFCADGVCPPVIGNVLVYLDDNHVTATYLETLAPQMEQELSAALGW